jgi:hypothetical protein
MNLTLTFEEAASLFRAAVGEGAMQPSRSLSTAVNGTWHLRNIRKPLAIVTSRGTVMDRIGGRRLDDELVTAADLASEIALAASSALDSGAADETLAQRVHRYEEALRLIGHLADDAAQEHGLPPLRDDMEWEEQTNAPK